MDGQPGDAAARKGFGQNLVGAPGDRLEHFRVWRRQPNEPIAPILSRAKDDIACLERRPRRLDVVGFNGGAIRANHHHPARPTGEVLAEGMHESLAQITVALGPGLPSRAQPATDLFPGIIGRIAEFDLFELVKSGQQRIDY